MTDESAPGTPEPPPFGAQPPPASPPPPPYGAEPPPASPPSQGSQPPPPYGYGPATPPPLAPNDERIWAMLSHLSYFAFAIVAPIIILLALGPRSPFVTDQAKEALNFHITVAIAAIASALLILVGIGLLLLPVVAIYGLVFAILASLKSYEGETYRYPLTIRFVS